MTIINQTRISSTDPRLGRHVLWDDRSRNFAAPRTTERRSVVHRWSGPLYDQSVGSCTVNAGFSCLNTAPNRKPYTRRIPESLVIPTYSRVTAIDPFPGTYPPDDTGSNELSACKIFQEMGLITRYTWGFGLDHCLDALVERPGCFGTNWYRGMFYPDAQGFVTPTGPIDGGHEWVAVGVNFEEEFIWAVQSWGVWGIGYSPHRQKTGYFKVRFSVLDRLLQEHGDFVVPIKEWS